MFLFMYLMSFCIRAFFNLVGTWINGSGAVEPSLKIVSFGEGKNITFYYFLLMILSFFLMVLMGKLTDNNGLTFATNSASDFPSSIDVNNYNGSLEIVEGTRPVATDFRFRIL